MDYHCLRGCRHSAHLCSHFPTEEEKQLKNINKGIAGSTLAILIAGVILIIAAIVLSLRPWSPEEEIDWNLTLVGSDGQQEVLSFKEVKDLPAVKARGGFFSTVGVVYGPYDIKGVPLKTLCDLVGGFIPSDVVLVSAADGYSAVYDYEQLNGEVDTFQADNLKQKPHGELEFLLIYEQDGEPLSDFDGKPLRLAIACPGDLITEGHWWVKWVNRIEIRHLPPAETED